MKLLALLALILFSSVFLSVAEEEEDIYEYAEDEVEERAFLIIQKKILEQEVSDGTNVTVVLTIFNAGTRAAAKIEIEELELPNGVELLEKEEIETPIEKLETGMSVSYKTIIRPTIPGQIVLQPTIVTYAPAVGSIEQQTGYSTVTYVVVLTTNEYLVSKVLLMGSYVTLGVLRTRTQWNRFGLILAVIVLFFALNYLWEKLSEARRERVRRRATEYIEKSQ